MVGATQTMDEDTFKWRVPFRMGKNVHKFEVRLGPPGGDKVGGKLFSYGYLQIRRLDYVFIRKDYSVMFIIQEYSLT